ncbi:hypothetical protein TUM20984_31570 [Mycobacterium antarcticum]|nr:hypothetical protein TUM20984_31570 [Mycolicibacterium sp. TUM20984]
MMPELPYPQRSVDVDGHRASVLVFTAILATAVGCGASDTGGGSGLDVAESSGSSIAAAGEESGTPIDVCSLLAPGDISALLGTAVDGASSDSRCVWENPDSLESVSVEIGSPGTAASGSLRDPEPGLEGMYTPGPDGMRFAGAGAIEFVAGGRANSVQVAVLSMVSDGSANDAAVDLARKIGPQIPE